MDFPLLTDAKVIMTKFLKKEFGLQPTGEATQEVMMSYFNLKHKLISQQPREVLISEGLMQKAQTYQVERIVNSIAQKFTAGGNLNPFLSKGVFRLNDHDYLLNDWAIHHLHLNDTKHKPQDYFNQRSDLLLFVHLTADRAYFIDIRRHDENYVFAQRDLLRGIRDNWSDINRKFLVRDEEMEVSPQFNEEEIHIMRKNGYMFFVQVDKHGYMPAGMGSACSGFSTKASMEMNEFHRHLYKYHSYAKEHKEELRLALAKKKGRPLNKLHISLVFKDWLFYIYEMNSQQFVNLDLSHYQPKYPDDQASLLPGNSEGVVQAT
jgi:hypothetical protein